MEWDDPMEDRHATTPTSDTLQKLEKNVRVYDSNSSAKFPNLPPERVRDTAWEQHAAIVHMERCYAMLDAERNKEKLNCETIPKL